MPARRQVQAAAGVIAAIAAALAVIPAPGGARGAQAQTSVGPAETTSDWPCVQRKVPRLSPAAVWSGPPIDGLEAEWRKDAGLQDFAQSLASRRTPIEEAGKLIAAFAASQDAANRQRRLTLLFAATFEAIDELRAEIMHGIERYTRNQRKLARGIDEARAEVEALQRRGASLEAGDKQNPDKERQDKADELTWRIRIFKERENSLRYVCETPTLLEQRLYQLAQEIQKHMQAEGKQTH